METQDIDSVFDTIDWRTRTASTLAADVQAAASGAPSHKKGSLVRQSAIVRTPDGSLVDFILPSSAALALSVAISNAETATELRDQITYSDSVTPFGASRSVDDESTGALFSYFECYFTCAIFSYLALEVFANEVISLYPKTPVTTDRGRCGKKDMITLRAEQLESKSSTEEKFAVVLPVILNKETPKGKGTWAAFRKLQKARNEVVHLKAEHSNPRLKRAEQLEQGTLLSRAFEEDVWEMPEAAIEMIEYFGVDRIDSKWLNQARERVKARSSRFPTQPPWGT